MHSRPFLPVGFVQYADLVAQASYNFIFYFHNFLFDLVMLCVQYVRVGGFLQKISECTSSHTQ